MKHIKLYEKYKEDNYDDINIELVQSAHTSSTDTYFKNLIDKGADVNYRHNGDTALIWAAYKGFIKKVQYLIEANANLDIQDSVGNTALILAAHSNNSFIVRMLIDAGAEWFIENDAKMYFLDYDFSIKKDIIEKNPEKYKKYQEKVELKKSSDKYNI